VAEVHPKSLRAIKARCLSIRLSANKCQWLSKTLLVVHHDLPTARNYFDMLLLLNMRVVAFGPTDEPVLAGRGRISLLYVDAAQRGRGLGAHLLRLAQHRLHDAGFSATALAVVEGNTPARAFYARMGGTEAGAFTDAGPIWPSDNILVVWGQRPAAASQSDSKGRVAPSRP